MTLKVRSASKRGAGRYKTRLTIAGWMMTAGLLLWGRHAPRGADQLGHFTWVEASPAHVSAASWELHLLLRLLFLPVYGYLWLCSLMRCPLFLPHAPLLLVDQPLWYPAVSIPCCHLRPTCPLCSGCPGERVRRVLGHTDALLMIHFISCAQENVAG